MVGAFAINDNTTAVQNAYGHYVEVRRYPNAGVTEGMEIGVINEGDLKQCQPYYMAQPGSTIGLFLGLGHDDVTPNNDNSMALGITGGNALWDRGILFNWNSVRQTPGIGSVALGMPPQFALVWYLNDGGASFSAGIPAALIRSDATSVSGLAHPPSLLFGNGSLAFDPGNNVDAAIFRVGENVLQSTQINTPAGTPYLSLNGLAGAAKSLFWQNSGTNRWAMQTDGRTIWRCMRTIPVARSRHADDIQPGGSDCWVRVARAKHDLDCCRDKRYLRCIVRCQQYRQQRSAGA